jgi:integrase
VSNFPSKLQALNTNDMRTHTKLNLAALWCGVNESSSIDLLLRAAFMGLYELRWRASMQEVKAVQVEQWLKSLPLAPGSKAKVRNIMSALYSHAIRWEWAKHDPITYVRQSAKRRKIPAILTIEQIKCFLSHLKEPCRTAAMLDAASGLRVGELLGLKWEDVNFEILEVNLTRSVVKQKITRCKTKASRKPIPLDPELAEILLSAKLQSPYSQPSDWVFASPHRNGK